MSKIKYITDKEGNKKEVIVPVKIWEQLLDELDELEDTIAYEEAKKQKNPQYIPIEELAKQVHARQQVQGNN